MRTDGSDSGARILGAGEVAPDFSLRASPERAFVLSEQRGGPVVLAFYPADWSPVCGDQMALYNEVLEDVQRHGAKLVGMSLDIEWCHSEFS